MATAQAKAEAKVLARRRELAQELVDLRRKHATIFDTMDSLKASLIAIATEGGESFKELFEQKGTVSVSASKERQFHGELPEVDATAFLALSEARRQKLIDGGIVKLTPKWSRADHGRVTVKVF